MQIHIALYRWKEGVPESKINEALDKIASLEEKIERIVEISWAKNQSKYSEGYTHVILVRGQDHKALVDYRAHPDHDAAAKLIESIEERGIGVDFTTPRTS